MAALPHEPRIERPFYFIRPAVLQRAGAEETA
jgi:hypothetical protein